MNKKMRESERCSPHGWTVDTLEEHLVAKITSLERYLTDLFNEREARNAERFEANKESVSIALLAVEKANLASMAASEKAILKAEAAQEKRNEASNEIRAAMVDQQKNFAPKAETDYRFSSMDKAMHEMKTAFAESGGKLLGKTEGLGIVGSVVLGAFAIVGVLTGIVSILIKMN